MIKLIQQLYAWLKRVLLSRKLEVPVTDVIEYVDESKDICTVEPVQPGDLVGIPGKRHLTGRLINTVGKWHYIDRKHMPKAGTRKTNIIKISKAKARIIHIAKAA